ncbi:hypothetical protein M885DRAFT_504817 [Pelagophyceae sp. CCMP2097]|nr:hypothetical protein M885DRAFT_504817 [Pelagophyceae sp. CCMP2097]
MFEDGASALQAAESLGNAVDEFRRCFVDAEDHRSEVRVRATISSGGAPCPKLHTDDIVLRCVVAFAGPATVVAPFAKPPSRLQRLVPASIALPALFSSPADDAEVSPELGDALLMKGSRWGPGHAPILHRSPMPTDAKRILVSFDRLCDVQSLGA